MQTPLPSTYPVIQKNGTSALPDVFFGHFSVESRVTSVAWVDATPSNFILFYCSKLLDWKCWKINVKSCSGPLNSLGRQKSVMQKQH
jgi:hypothetical protein